MSDMADYSGIEKLRARILTRKRIWREYFMTCFSETDKTINDIWKVQADTIAWLRCTDCKHEEEQRVKFITMDNREVHRMQCLMCGRLGNQIKKEEGVWPYYLDVFLMIEDVLDEIREYAKGMEDSARDNQADDWHRQYTEYLESQEWRSRHDAVLARDNNRCTARLPGCAGRATEVHHTTYEHVFNEPLFELTSICRPCHLKITEADRERRKS